LVSTQVNKVYNTVLVDIIMQKILHIVPLATVNKWNFMFF